MYNNLTLVCQQDPDEAVRFEEGPRGLLVRFDCGECQNHVQLDAEQVRALIIFLNGVQV